VLAQAGEDAREFFRKVFFTHSERESILAVAVGLANSAEIDNFMWDAITSSHPELTAQTRIVAKSHDFGAPPFVASRFVTKSEFADMLGVLVGMAQDLEGQALLKRMNCDGFVPANAALYDSIVEMKKALREE